MINISRQDTNNLNSFSQVVTRAYKEVRTTGRIPGNLACTFDKLIVCPAKVVSPFKRPVDVHRKWRRRVARLYFRSHPVRDGLFDWDINWEEIYNWILENIIPIMKILLTLIPLFI